MAVCLIVLNVASVAILWIVLGKTYAVLYDNLNISENMRPIEGLSEWVLQIILTSFARNCRVG